jgi:hypothetical protein
MRCTMPSSHIFVSTLSGLCTPVIRTVTLCRVPGRVNLRTCRQHIHSTFVPDVPVFPILAIRRSLRLLAASGPDSVSIILSHHLKLLE